MASRKNNLIELNSILYLISSILPFIAWAILTILDFLLEPIDKSRLGAALGFFIIPMTVLGLAIAGILATILSIILFKPLLLILSLQQILVFVLFYLYGLSGLRDPLFIALVITLYSIYALSSVVIFYKYKQTFNY